MASPKKKKPVKKRSKEEELLESIEMYKMWRVRTPIAEICAKFGGISERTAQRRIEEGEVFTKLADKIVPQGYKGEIQSPESPKKKIDPPGVVSRGIMVRPPQGSNPGAIALPTNNPLASITEIADIGKVGIHTGVLLGGMAHQIHGALIRTDLPLDERMMMMTRGSAAVGNALLGAVEFFRTLNETANGPIKEVNDGQ